MARPRRVSDEDILGAVRRAALDEGPRFSLEQVADRLGVTTPALFRRFRHRDELLIAALRPDESPPYIEALDKGPDDRPVESQLAQIFTEMCRDLEETLPCLSALRESGIRDVDKVFCEPPLRRVVSALGGWLERARRAGLIALEHPEEAALALLGSVQAPIFFRYLTGHQREDWDASQFGRRVADWCLRGMKPQPKQTRDETGIKEPKAPQASRASQRRKEPL